ncbi:BnaA09g09590D [Brassica napus]|uniref:BnaA09g09590D protein n=1 Tax=Brassica napus TaxID=3708 RepID=A0A078H0F8_BRANA|nr:BnaA09g09590D [Brassica napus]
MCSPTASNSFASHDALMLPVWTWYLLPPRSRASLSATGAPEIYIFKKIRHSGEVPETPPTWLAGSFVCSGEPLNAPCSSGASTLPSSSDHPKPFISLVVISEGSGMRRICCSWARPVTAAVEALASSILRSGDTRSATPNVLLAPPPLFKRNLTGLLVGKLTQLPHCVPPKSPSTPHTVFKREPSDLPQRGLTRSSPTTQPASHRNLIPISKQNEYDDSLLKFLSVTTSWPRHGNVKVRVSNPIKLYASSPNSIVLNTFLKVKLELEIHLVSWISLVIVRAVSMRFNAKSRHLKPFDTIAVEKDSPASLSMRGESFRVFNPVLNSSKSLSLGYFNVVSDYLKLFRAVVSRIQVKIICGFLYFEQLTSGCNR